MLGGTVGTCLRSRSWLCGRGQQSQDPALAPSITLCGWWLKAVPGSTSSPPYSSCVAGKGLEKVAAQSLLAGLLAPGLLHQAVFSWMHPPVPPPALTLGTKHVF